MSDETQWYEYGYRTERLGDVWPVDYGTDGAWTSAYPEFGLGAIDMYDGQEVEAIRREITRANVEGVIIRRLVKRTEGDPEVIEQVTRAAAASAERRANG